MVEQVLSIMKSERCPPVVRVRPTKFRYLRFVQGSDTALSKALQIQNSSLIKNNWILVAFRKVTVDYDKRIRLPKISSNNKFLF